MLKLLFLVASVALTLAFWGGGGLASAQGGPPSVEPGTADWNCQRIQAAGYSPHDYIYRADAEVVAEELTEVYAEYIDYWHTSSLHNPGGSLGQPQFNQIILYSNTGPLIVDNADEEGYWYYRGEVLVHADTDVEIGISSNPDILRERYGFLLDADGNEFAHDSGASFAFFQPDFGILEDVYIWRPGTDKTDSSNDIIYRDTPRQLVRIERDVTWMVDSEWVHIPNWQGPDTARMSHIWGESALCTR